MGQTPPIIMQNCTSTYSSYLLHVQNNGGIQCHCRQKAAGELGSCRDNYLVIKHTLSTHRGVWCKENRLIKHFRRVPGLLTDDDDEDDVMIALLMVVLNLLPSR